MKFKTILGALAVSSVMASGSALATPFTIDVNAFDTSPFPGTDGVTGLIHQLGLNWSATSVFTDDNGVAGINAGDSVLDTGFGSINSYLDANAQALSGFEANEGVGGSHLLRFDYTNLVGKVVATDGGNGILAKYTAGQINVYYDNTPGAVPNNDGLAMTLDVFNSTGTIGNLILFSKVSYVNPNTFFFNGVTDWNDLTVAITSRLDFNLDPLPLTQIGNTNQYTRTATLDGSASFNVPEPGVLALMGLGLVGIGFSRRNKKQA